MGEWVNGFLSNVQLTAAVGLQMSGFEPSLFSFCIFFRFLCFPFFFWRWMGGISYYWCCSYYYVFHSIPKIYLFGVSKLPKVWRTFLLAASVSPKNPRKSAGYLLRCTRYHLGNSRATVGPVLQSVILGATVSSRRSLQEGEMVCLLLQSDGRERLL